MIGPIPSYSTLTLALVRGVTCCGRLCSCSPCPTGWIELRAAASCVQCDYVFTLKTARRRMILGVLCLKPLYCAGVAVLPWDRL